MGQFCHTINVVVVHVMARKGDLVKVWTQSCSLVVSMLASHSVNVLVASPGAGKTFLVLVLLSYFFFYVNQVNLMIK